MSAVFTARCEFKPMPRLPFSDSHVEQWVKDFADTTGDALMDLEDMGCDLQVGCADMLRSMCKAWLRDPAAVHAVAGTYFWQLAKDCAFSVYQSYLD